MAKKENNRKGLHPVEWVFYSIAAVVAILGIVSLVFGIVGYHLNVPPEDNFIALAEAKIVLNFRYWGLILIGSGALIAVIVLSIFAQSADRKYEKNLRRQQRLSSSKISEMEIKPAVETIEVESKPVTE